MIFSRFFYAAMMGFWIFVLVLMALVTSYAPKGGVELAGLTLFSTSSMTEGFGTAMTAMGISVTGQGVLFGIVGGLNVAAAGLTLFAMLFCVLGQEIEQDEARPLAEGAAVCTAGAAAVTVFVGLGGGQAGALMAVEIAALCGLVLTVLSLAHRVVELDQSSTSTEAETLDRAIAEHAANHAAFSAQLASLSRRELLT